MKLYRWQRECLRAWEENGCRGIAHVATGAGKTVFALAALAALRERWPDLEVKVVVPTVPLARQWIAALAHDAPSEAWRPGLFGGGRRDGEDRRVMVYIVNSARDALPAHMRRAFALNRHALLICDECHRYLSPHNRRIFDFITQPVLSGGLYACLGLSATPFGTADDALLTRALGGEIYRYGIDDAVTEGVLSAFSVCEVSASFLADELEEYCRLTEALGALTAKLNSLYPELRPLSTAERLRAIQRIARAADMDPEHPASAYLLTAYRRRDVCHLARARSLCCLALLERLRARERTLVFCERIDQAEALLADARRRWGGAVGIYHSRMSAQARARNMEAFRTGAARILISCRCLDEGIDVPEASVGIVLSGSSVPRQRVQRLGRILRAAPGKDAACLYYIYIREAVEDAAYLPGLEACETFSLRYYTSEGDFSNELYEYVAAGLLERARNMTAPQLRELRACLAEGLTRADCLLPPQALERRARQAPATHERNYWRCMRKLAEEMKSE